MSGEMIETPKFKIGHVTDHVPSGVEKGRRYSFSETRSIGGAREWCILRLKKIQPHVSLKIAKVAEKLLRWLKVQPPYILQNCNRCSCARLPSSGVTALHCGDW